VVTTSYHFQQVAADVAGSEGPVFDRAGTFYCVAPDRGQVLALDADGTLRELANTGGIPAGLQADARGRLWVADMKLGILRVDPANGSVRGVVRDFDVRPIRGCNDLAFDSRGNLYFTAPAGSKSGTPLGEVFSRTRDGQVLRLDGGFEFCNGIAVTADDCTLVVAETWPKKLWAYDITSPGAVANRRLFATLSGDHVGGPDGIDYDVEGNLLVTNWGGACIEVFDPRGRRVEKIDLPFGKPSNLHFGGADGRDLWITEHTHMGVWKTRWRSAGLTRFPDVQ
jgi:gluconolactonase